MCIHAATAGRQQKWERQRESLRGRLRGRHKKLKNTEEGYGEIRVRQRKTGKAQCKSEYVNMYRPNLIIALPPGPVIRCLIEAGDEREVGGDVGRREDTGCPKR